MSRDGSYGGRIHPHEGIGVSEGIRRGFGLPTRTPLGRDRGVLSGSDYGRNFAVRVRLVPHR